MKGISASLRSYNDLTRTASQSSHNDFTTGFALVSECFHNGFTIELTLISQLISQRFHIGFTTISQQQQCHNGSTPATSSTSPWLQSTSQSQLSPSLAPTPASPPAPAPSPSSTPSPSPPSLSGYTVLFFSWSLCE